MTPKKIVPYFFVTLAHGHYYYSITIAPMQMTTDNQEPEVRSVGPSKVGSGGLSVCLFTVIALAPLRTIPEPNGSFCRALLFIYASIGDSKKHYGEVLFGRL